MIKTIENSRLRLTFDTEINNVTELINKKTGDNYIKSIPGNTIFSLWCMEKGSNKKEKFIPLRPAVCIIKPSISEIEPTACDSLQNGQSMIMELSYSGLLGESTDLSIDAKLTASIKDDCNIEWKMELKNNDNVYDIVEVLFPHIRGIYLGETWEDDTVIYPHHAGEKTLNPVEVYTSDRFMSFWRAKTVLEDNVYYREINYCGLASMMWMYYYDNKNGFYISSHDSDFPVTGMRVETGGALDPWMGFGIRKYIRIKTGEEWKSNAYIISINCDDWHWGAQVYRKWIEPYIMVNNQPAFLKNEYALNQCYNFKKDSKIHNKFDRIPELFNTGKEEFGLRHMFIASWNRRGFDCNYPEYYPDMELGTSMDLYNGCKYVNDNKGFVTFYINSRIFDVKSDYFPTLGRDMSIKKEDGSMINEEYGPVKFSVLCPSNAEWQKRLIDTAEWMVRSYGATGIYLDQLGSAEPFPCYDEEHSHKDIGEFNKGYLNIIKELKEKISKLNQNAFLMIENCGDIYGSYIWGSLTWNGDPYDEYYNVFKYTFPEYVQVNMINPRGNETGRERTARFYADIERALLLGSILWLGVTYKFDKEDEELKQYAKNAINFRKKLCPIIESGKYADDDGIIAQSPGIKSSRWVLDNGDELIIAGNINEQSGCHLTLAMDGRPLRLILEDINGNTPGIKYRFQNGRLEIALPESKIMYMLIVKEK